MCGYRCVCVCVCVLKSGFLRIFNPSSATLNSTCVEGVRTKCGVILR